MSGPAHLRIEVLYLYVLQQQDWRTQQKVQQEKCANRKNVHSESTKQTEHEELRGSVRWTGFSWCSEKQSLSRSSMVPNLIPADTPTYLGPHLYRHNWCVCKLPECWKKKKKKQCKTFQVCVPFPLMLHWLHPDSSTATGFATPRQMATIRGVINRNTQNQSSPVWPSA